MSATVKLRCAVYTRKSSEEGLDQEFNSLDAQREACVAYIASQAGLGWKLIPTFYDDGGISGGTMERPALQRLLQDIRDRRIDVVVVYKIDRLTRSLMDFSKIVEIFDASSVSFVSVTQAFNTTSSMGRLTLNVLLSFAQFEREVTAERIRDKFAASRKKGMWMGGRVPFGYKVTDRHLVVDECDAKIVQQLFGRYLELKSVLALAEELNRRLGVEDHRASGTDTTGSLIPWSRGKLYYLLANPLYIGKVKHHDQYYDGEHQAIIDVDQFDAVQALLKGQSSRRRGSSPNNTDIHLLTGIVFDETGDHLSPTHAKNHGKRYRYYVSQRLKDPHNGEVGGWRLPAKELDDLALHQIQGLLTDQKRLTDWIQLHTSSEQIKPGLEAARVLATQDPSDILRSIIARITLSPGKASFQIDRQALVTMLCGGKLPIRIAESLTESDDASPLITIDLPISIRRRGVGTRTVIDSHVLSRLPDQMLVNTVAKAHFYLAKLTDGSFRNIADLAKHCGVHRADISRILPLAFLSPKITQAILTGQQPVDLSVRRLARLIDLPLTWSDQEQALGF